MSLLSLNCFRNQEEESMSNTNHYYSQAMIKQEIVDESYTGSYMYVNIKKIFFFFSLSVLLKFYFFIH